MADKHCILGIALLFLLILFGMSLNDNHDSDSFSDVLYSVSENQSSFADSSVNGFLDDSMNETNSDGSQWSIISIIKHLLGGE